MNHPLEYCDWIEILERFGSGDDSGLSRAAVEEEEWDSPIQSRLLEALRRETGHRLDLISKTLMEDIESSTGEAFLFSESLVRFKRQVQMVGRFTTIPAIPKSASDQLAEHLRGYVANISQGLQEALDESTDPYGVIELEIRLCATDIYPTQPHAACLEKDLSPPEEQIEDIQRNIII